MAPTNRKERGEGRDREVGVTDQGRILIVISTIPAPLSYATNGRMDKTIRKYTDFDEMKADEYRYWQSRPAHERLDAVEEMIETAYALKGWGIEPDVPRLQRPFVRLPCPWR